MIQSIHAHDKPRRDRNDADRPRDKRAVLKTIHRSFGARPITPDAIHLSDSGTGLHPI